MAASTSASGATNEQDRLGALPDSILLVILSLVPTLDAVRSSVLSRRWRYLWTSVGALDFEDDSDKFFFVTQNYGSTGKRKRGTEVKENRKGRFAEFVDKVLTFHHTPALQRLRLSCSGSMDRAVEDWVRVAVTRDVRELDLRLRLGGGRRRLPSRLFVSHSLVDLKLDMGGSYLDLPSALGLASLRSMHLSDVSFRDDHLTRELFSSCAALRSLVMVNCRYYSLRHLEISSPTLQRLTLNCPSRIHGLRNCQVKISAPQLTFFKYLAQAYDMERLSSLVDTEVEFHGCEDWNMDLGSEDWDENEDLLQNRRLLLVRVQGFLHQLSYAKNLKICHVCVEALSETLAGCPTRSYSLFGRLNRLQMTTYRTGYTIPCLILELLVANPSLQALALEFLGSAYIYSSDSDSKEEYFQILGVYSKQTSGMLEEVDIKCGGLSEAVLDLVKNLLENQACLEKLLLDCRSCYATGYLPSSQRNNSGWLKQLMQKVLSFPRRSRNLAVGCTFF